MTYTPEQISLKVLKEIKTPDVLTLSLDEKIKLVKDPKATAETLSVLATDEDSDVRYWVARHPNATEIVKRLVLMTNSKRMDT